MEGEGLLPGFVAGYTKIHHDEHRHIGYGIWFLRERLPEDQRWARSCGILIFGFRRGAERRRCRGRRRRRPRRGGRGASRLRVGGLKGAPADRRAASYQGSITRTRPRCGSIFVGERFPGQPQDLRERRIAESVAPGPRPARRCVDDFAEPRTT